MKSEELKPCPFCGGNEDLKVEVYQCDRNGWERGWEPSITCSCGISFGIGFAGSGCDPDDIETRIIKHWNSRHSNQEVKNGQVDCIMYKQCRYSGLPDCNENCRHRPPTT